MTNGIRVCQGAAGVCAKAVVVLVGKLAEAVAAGLVAYGLREFFCISAGAVCPGEVVAGPVVFPVEDIIEACAFVHPGIEHNYSQTGPRALGCNQCLLNITRAHGLVSGNVSISEQELQLQCGFSSHPIAVHALVYLVLGNRHNVIHIEQVLERFERLHVEESGVGLPHVVVVGAVIDQSVCVSISQKDQVYAVALGCRLQNGNFAVFGVTLGLIRISMAYVALAPVICRLVRTDRALGHVEDGKIRVREDVSRGLRRDYRIKADFAKT